MRTLILGCPGFACFECSRGFLQAQGYFAAGLYVFAACVPIQIVLTWLFVAHLEYGIEEIALALSVTCTLLPFGMVIYSKLLTSSKCWRRLTWEIFEHWSTLLRLAFPSLVMYEADCIAFEMLEVMAGRMGIPELGAHTLLITLCGFIYRTPLSLGVAAGTELARRLRERSLDHAVEATRMSIALAGGIAMTVFISLSALHNDIPRLLTTEEQIVRLMQPILPILGGFMFFDAFVGVMNGILRGIGKQKYGATLQLIGYYMIGLPVSAMTGFGLRWNLKGLWTGISVAMIVVASLEAVYLRSIDWEQLVNDATEPNVAEQEDGR